MVALDEKSGDCQSYQNTSSWNHSCLYQIWCQPEPQDCSHFHIVLQLVNRNECDYTMNHVVGMNYETLTLDGDLMTD